MRGMARVKITVTGSREKSFSSSRVILARLRKSLPFVELAALSAGQPEEDVLQGRLLHL